MQKKLNKKLVNKETDKVSCKQTFSDHNKVQKKDYNHRQKIN